MISVKCLSHFRGIISHIDPTKISIHIGTSHTKKAVEPSRIARHTTSRVCQRPVVLMSSVGLIGSSTYVELLRQLSEIGAHSHIEIPSIGACHQWCAQPRGALVYCSTAVDWWPREVLGSAFHYMCAASRSSSLLTLLFEAASIIHLRPCLHQMKEKSLCKLKTANITYVSAPWKFLVHIPSCSCRWRSICWEVQPDS
eukprot:scaffold215538_cov17-Tisochrysis_lutea.AAC.1